MVILHMGLVLAYSGIYKSYGLRILRILERGVVSLYVVQNPGPVRRDQNAQLRCPTRGTPGGQATEQSAVI